MTRIYSILLSIVLACSMQAADVLPVTGSWINLFYQDVRNKYSNPKDMDNTDPVLWRAKVREMHDMGVEYIVFMAVANEGKAVYPSKIMPLGYNSDRESPVSAILDEASSLGMKAFLSIGWAENQDDNLRIPAILNRQKEIMAELAEIYRDCPAFYGWYLPVEDCLGPVLTDAAVVAVNNLVERAHSLTPGKKTLISPYGFFRSDFDNPRFGEQIERLKVDIIAYQDEVGCVREKFPMPRLKMAWKKMREIHNRTGIEFWANCELFTWEAGTNSRESALIPAAFPRVLSQLVAATDGGVERIISFMTCGIWSLGNDGYSLGQPSLSKCAATDYMAWRNGDRRWKLLEASMRGELKSLCGNGSILTDGIIGEETPEDTAWQQFKPGSNTIEIPTGSAEASSVFLRFLNCAKKGIGLPYKVYLYAGDDSDHCTLVSVSDVEQFPNKLHDTWVDCVELPLPSGVRHVKVVLQSTTNVALDELYIL